MAATTDARPQPTRVIGSAREPSVLAIVVSHNGREWLRDCLSGLANQTFELMDVLVVDDASAGHKSEYPTLKRIAKRHLRRRRWGYLRTPRPLGFGGAINWALGRVRTDADYLLFIHDDAALDRTSVRHMVDRLASDPDTAIVGPKVVAWDDPYRLEEIGMASDRFGYPYKGLEDGEIDLGQHDRSSEVFYVTSTCMLVKHSVFRELHGWDSQMRAFAEDLDLCWRTRLTGKSIRVEPRAKVRHAVALAKGLRLSPFYPPRYFIRRNRLRTVVKNASALRLIALIPQFVVLAFVEMIGFIVLRQPREILNLARALGWNLLRLPQTIAERTRVQRRREISDRQMRSLMVRETTRIRSYWGLVAQRLEIAWGKRAELFARRAAEARALSRRLFGWQGALLVAVVLCLLVGLRHVLWPATVVAGEILPYPEGASTLLRELVSPWQTSWLGHPGPGAPGFAILGLLPVVLLGATGLSQKVLLIGLGVVAFVGAAKMTADIVDRPARIVAGLSYAFGGVGYAGLRSGSLGALVFGAAAPFVVAAMIRLIGWVRPPGFVRGRAAAQIALGAAVSAAFVPGSLVLYAFAAAALTGLRALFGGGRKAIRGLATSLIGLAVGWGLLLPWSAEWFGPGGPGARLMSDETSYTFARTFSGHSIGTVMLGQTPEVPALLGVALLVLGLVAVGTGEGVRRALALGLWTVAAAMGVVVSAIAAGTIRPLVASPTEAGVLASLSLAGLAGLAVGAFRLDLTRRQLGVGHAITVTAFVVAGFLAAAGIAPALLRGEWGPGPAVRSRAETLEQVTSVLTLEADRRGRFRALWVEPSRFESGRAAPSALKPAGIHSITGPGGERLSDLFADDGVPGDDDLRGVIDSIEAGATDVGGALLGAFNIDFVVIERGEAMSRWLAQRDLALIRSERDYLLFENRAGLVRAGLYRSAPAAVAAVEAEDARLLTNDGASESRPATAAGATEYVLPAVRGPGVVWLAESANPVWKAEVGNRPLRRIGPSWGNAFDVPDGVSGPLGVEVAAPASHELWLIELALAWVVVVGAAFSSRQRNHRRRPR